MQAPDRRRANRHALQELAYRVQWRASDVHLGSHRSCVDGSGEEFRGTAPLAPGRDARRIDLRASLVDPWERPWVREFRQRSRVAVTLLADLSPSMRFVGRTDRLRLVGDFARALSNGAARRGDPFGFIGCDTAVRRELLLQPTRSRQGGERVARQLEALRTTPHSPGASSAGADGLLEAARWLPRQRSMVFLLSDLYIDPALFERLLQSLVPHEVIVVLLADRAEAQPPARWGLVRLADLETGRERLVVLRPSLADRMAERQAARIAAARRRAQRQGATLLVVQDELDLTAMAQHFLRLGRT